MNNEETIQKAVKPEISKDTLLNIIQELQELIVGIVSTEDCDCGMPGCDCAMGECDCGTEDDMTEVPEMEGMPEMEDANPAPIGDPNKNDINWPVSKVEGQLIVNEEERRILDQSKPETVAVKKSVWTGSLDPITFTKRKFTTAQRKEEAASGHAMPDGSYPIANKKDLENAIRSWGRGGAKADVKAHIKRRAKALGAQDMIPENWK